MATLGTFAAFSSKGYSGTGGSVTLPTGGNYIIENNGSGKRVHVYTSSGTFTVPDDINVGTFEAEVLVIGGGGNAGTPYGGGGGGGAVVYDSSFRFGANMSFSIVVGGAGGTSSMFGLPAAPGGGQGGRQADYSKGQSGGTGGGGSWQNGTPNGPDLSTANPGAIWGTTGPTPSGTFSPSLSLVAIGPDYSPYGSVTRDFTNRFHDVGGNGNYRNNNPAPSNDDVAIPGIGLASDSPFGGNAWRARGGGGGSFVGGLGGEGLATKFIDKESTWRWIGSGGHGVSGRSYWDQVSSGNGQGWRDRITVNGFGYDYLDTTSTALSAVTDFDNIATGTVSKDPAGISGYGSGGNCSFGQHYENNGKDGIVVLRYDLESYPGGLAAASANIFGGTITTSANGKYRYHTFTTAGDGQGTSTNSYSWYISGDYHPRSFPTSTTDVEITQPSPGANITPFYYYGEMPTTTIDYMIIGAGGATGTKGAIGGTPRGDAVHYGGGGSGGIRSGSFTLYTDTVARDNESTLSETLANTQQHISTSCRPGFIEVYVNGLFANNRLHPRQYVYSSSSTAENTDPVNNAVQADFQPHIRKSRYITLRGRWGANTVQQAKVIRKVYSAELGSGYWGNSTDGSAGPDSNKAFLTINGPLNAGNPDSNPDWGDSINLSTFDHYYYPDYTRVWIGPLEGSIESETNIPRNQSAVLPSSSSSYNYTLGELLYEGANTHPNTPEISETYYTTLKINSALCKWSRGKNASDVSSTIWSKITGNNLNNFAETNRDFILGPNHTYLGTTNYGTSAELKIQWVIENDTGESSRRFVYIENGYDTNQFGVYTLPAGWRFVDLRSGSSNKLGACAALYGTYGNGIRPTRIQIYRKDLRRFYVRKIPCYDISVGSGGGAGFWGPIDRRYGGVSAMKLYESSSLSSSYVGARGGSGGWLSYTSTDGTSGLSIPDDTDALLSERITDSIARGSGGGGLWDQRSLVSSSTASDNTGSNNGSPSRNVELYGGGASGGGAFSTRNIGAFAFVGATRSSTFSDGRRNNRNSLNSSSSGHGGRGFFGSSSNWAYETRTLSFPEGTFYYYINVDQYPHNGNFGAGGGGGAGGNGGNASTGGVGGSGGSGYTSSITGYSITYAHGGGAFGRKRNGPPGSSQPANPADQTYASGAPESPAYLPYGGGGGWSAGAQEGFGSTAVSYYPGNQPWPLAYDVTFNEDHMDAMRFWNSGVPAPQKGNLGTAYNGKQGVVIIAYNRAPFIYT